MRTGSEDGCPRITGSWTQQREYSWDWDKTATRFQKFGGGKICGAHSP